MPGDVETDVLKKIKKAAILSEASHSLLEREYFRIYHQHFSSLKPIIKFYILLTVHHVMILGK